MNTKISVFVICVEAIIYFLLYNWHDCTFNIFQLRNLLSDQNLSRFFFFCIIYIFWHYHRHSFELKKFLMILRYVLAIAQYRVQYGKYFSSFSYVFDLFHELLGEWNKMQKYEKQQKYVILHEQKCNNQSITQVPKYRGSQIGEN